MVRIDWPIHFFMAAGLAAIFLLSPLGAGTSSMLLRDPDNYMRLVQVRDLLGGQSWWDVTQYRMGSGELGNMHWSRLADIPLAGLIVLFSLFVAQPKAELWAVIVEPPLLFVFASAFLALAAGNIGGAAASKIARIVSITAMMFIVQFLPGRIDHHNIQLTLVAAVLAALTMRDTAKQGFVAAGAVALSLNIGLEMAPVLASAAIWLAIRWLWIGRQAQPVFKGFLLGMLLFTPAFLALSVLPADWLRATSDQLGRAHLGVVILGSAIMLLMLIRPGQTFATRLAQLSAAGIAVAPFAFLTPELLAGPYGNIDPALRALWIDNVSETASLADLVANRPGDLFNFYFLSVLSLVAGAAILVRNKPNRMLALSMFMLAVSFGFALWQLRASAAAAMIAVVVASCAIAQLWERRERPHGLALAIGAGVMLNGWIGPVTQHAFFETRSPSAAAGGGSRENLQAGPIDKSAETISTCERAVMAANLNEVEPGLVLSGTDAGAPILLRSAHSVLAATYHRNAPGTGLAFSILQSRPENALVELTERGVDYVFYCPSPEFGGLIEAEDGSLGELVAAGRPPAWMELIEVGDNPDFALYAVK